MEKSPSNSPFHCSARNAQHCTKQVENKLTLLAPYFNNDFVWVSLLNYPNNRSFLSPILGCDKGTCISLCTETVNFYKVILNDLKRLQNLALVSGQKSIDIKFVSRKDK